MGQLRFSRQFKKVAERLCLAQLICCACLAFVLPALSSCKKDPVEEPPPPPPPVEDFFIRAVDLSFTPEISEDGVDYSDGESVKPILQIMKDKGINTVRLRLWHTPTSGHSTLSEVSNFAADIKQAGFRFWLDIHYSDTWCDPANQSKPAAWNSLPFETLKDSVHSYTKYVMNTLVQAGAAPDFVQIGNETNNGMLWPEGMIYSTTGTSWSKFRELLQEGLMAVNEVSPTTATMVHYGNYDGADFYFSNLTSMNPDFDMIAISYYPAWHGKNLDEVQSAIETLVSKYQKPVVIAETAYPWTLGWNDWTNNLVGLQDQLIPVYPATPEGQAAYVSSMIDLLESNANADNFGLSYWAPDWVAYKGTTATDGSSWENQALFDFTFKALPALDSLGRR